MKAKFIFNGKEYQRLDELPPEAREAFRQAGAVFADRNHNGIPDVLENGAGQVEISFTVAQSGEQTILFEGREYSSPDDLPPEAAEAYQRAMSALGNPAPGNRKLEVDRALELKTTSTVSRTASAPGSPRARPALPLTPSVFTDDAASHNRLYRLAAAILLLLIGAVVALLLQLLARG